jgi:hypothetical protein
MPKSIFAFWLLSAGAHCSAFAQSLGNYGSLHGLVVDSSESAVVSAQIVLQNRLTGIQRTVSSGARGDFQINGIPFGSYRIVASAPGFQDFSQLTVVESPVPRTVTCSLVVAGSSTSVEVVGGVSGSVDFSPVAHGVVDRELMDRLPVQNQATGLSEMVTRTTPGVAADGNGFAHPLGEHADTSISLDNQPITDQQAKIFSNQISASIVQTMELITGAPPAEFGDKTSLIINVTTRSGLGQRKPTGSISSSYESFGTWSGGLTYGTGSSSWGNFIALNASGAGRFLDTPEFTPLHDHGNAESIFDRLDWQADSNNSFHLNLSAARSWFQTPNTFDSAESGQDQRSQIRSFNIAPAWTHLINPRTLLTFNPFFRFDRSQYFPSANLLADRPAALSQSRYLANVGFRSDLSYSAGIHNAKLGTSYWHTPLREDFNLGITDPAFSTPGLVPYDLTRGGRLYSFHGSTAVNEAAVYIQDTITIAKLTLSPGLRYDSYQGLSRGHQLQPRFGLAYRTPVTNTGIRLSYARLFETPYNENLIIASEATRNTQSQNPFAEFRSEPPRPGARNQFNVGLGQSFGRLLSIDADYFWKFTKNAFDFASLFLTPITFPIGWRKSKIDGLALRVTLAEIHGFSAYSVMGHTRSRFFGPETGGLIFNNVPDNGVFRIDHSEEFEHTTVARYQYGKHGPWLSFTWRFNSGLALPGVVPDYNSALMLTADQQAQMGLYCGTTFATRWAPLRSCDSSRYGATRVSIPPPGTENNDTRPTRVHSRSLYDLGLGLDNLLRTDSFKLQARVTVLNLSNKVALYNFLSTFSGTHFVTPRTIQTELRLVF